MTTNHRIGTQLIGEQYSESGIGLSFTEQTPTQPSKVNVQLVNGSVVNVEFRSNTRNSTKRKPKKTDTRNQLPPLEIDPLFNQQELTVMDVVQKFGPSGGDRPSGQLTIHLLSTNLLNEKVERVMVITLRCFQKKLKSGKNSSTTSRVVEVKYGPSVGNYERIELFDYSEVTKEPNKTLKKRAMNQQMESNFSDTMSTSTWDISEQQQKKKKKKNPTVVENILHTTLTISTPQSQQLNNFVTTAPTTSGTTTGSLADLLFGETFDVNSNFQTMATTETILHQQFLPQFYSQEEQQQAIVTNRSTQLESDITSQGTPNESTIDFNTIFGNCEENTNNTQLSIFGHENNASDINKTNLINQLDELFGSDNDDIGSIFNF